MIADLETYTIQDAENPEVKYLQPQLLMFTPRKGVVESCEGDDCFKEFIEELKLLTYTDDSRQRDVEVHFHNLKGFDGTFIRRKMQEMGHQPERQISVGA